MIPVSQARGIFTKTLVDVYKEMPRPTDFLRSFFTVKESSSKYVSIEVMRGTEKVAVDVLRGTEGNRNTFSRSSEKIFEPPYYREFMDATDLDFYDRLFGMAGGEVTEVQFGEWIVTVAEKLQALQDKIERAIEVQCAQVMQTGIITLQNATNIDFKRKAASIVDASTGAGEYWDNTAGDPVADLTTGCQFIRNVGKSTDGTFNLILGERALNALLDNDNFKARADIRNYNLDAITGPQRNAAGAAFHGEISVGAYKLRLWTYPQAREVSGTMTPYIDPTFAIILPLMPRMTLAFGAVPVLRRDPSNVDYPEFMAYQRGAFHVSNYIDQRTESHVFDVKSAPVAIPTAVDQIYTIKTLA